ncbi:hypothetical protein EJB05_38819, partial [Eragrostis curvula]
MGPSAPLARVSQQKQFYRPAQQHTDPSSLSRAPSKPPIIPAVQSSQPRIDAVQTNGTGCTIYYKSSPYLIAFDPPPPQPRPAVSGSFPPPSPYAMAGGNLFGRALSYVVNEFLVEGLANNRAFQRFAVKTNRTLENLSSKVKEVREEVSEQFRDARGHDDHFKR